MPFATQDLPVPRKLLARAFTLGNPLHHRRQRVLLHHDHMGRWHHLDDGMGRVPQRDGHAQEGADAEQQPTQHEGRQAACQPHPPTPASACANTRRPASGREDLSGGPETMEHGSLLHTRSLGMREPSQRRSGEEGHDAVASGADGTRAGTVPGASRRRGRTAHWSTPEASPLLNDVKASVSLLLKEPWSWNREEQNLCHAGLFRDVRIRKGLYNKGIGERARALLHACHLSTRDEGPLLSLKMRDGAKRHTSRSKPPEV
jgi:hypothetical protein